MTLTDDIAGLTPVARPQSSWVSDLINKRTEAGPRLKRSPVGFQFERDPFDPSSYYRALGTFKDISRGATAVSTQEANNRQQAQYDRESAQNQRDVLDRMNGVDPNFTGAGGYVYDKSGLSRKYGLKGISVNTSRAANYFGSRYGIKTIGGRGPGSVPGSDHPKGRALDFMINNVSGGKKRGTDLANDVIKNWKRWNIKYVIWNRYIWYPGRGWHKYNGPSPHTDHVHVSFNR